MKKEKLDIKLRFPRKGLYQIILERIISCREGKEEIIKFPPIFSKLCSSLQLNKEQIWEIFFLLHDSGFIEIVNGHGIVVNQLVNQLINKNSKEEIEEVFS